MLRPFRPAICARLLVLFLAVLFAGVNISAGAAEGAKTLYTCGMHPQIILDHPGNCPICGMKLTPIHKGDGPEAGEFHGDRGGCGHGAEHEFAHRHRAGRAAAQDHPHRRHD